MGARLSTSPLPELADPGRSQPLPPRGAPRGTSPPLRSSQPPVSRKLTPRASSRAARWGCRLRDLHGLGLRKDQHACELFTFGLRVCVGLLCRPRGPEDRLDSWLRWAPGLPAERRSAPRMARLFRAWRTCWDLPERRGEPGPCQGVELEARRRPGLRSGVAGWQGTAPCVPYSALLGFGGHPRGYDRLRLLAFLSFCGSCPPLLPLGSDFLLVSFLKTVFEVAIQINSIRDSQASAT